MEKKVKYPIRAEDYELFEVIGQGVSAAVYRALCIPLDEVVAIKILDFERNNSDLSNITREAQTMILIDHPNVLKAHCSFVNDQNLWVVMPYMAGGSCLHIMKSAYPNGFEEPVIATILREVLKGLEYLHQYGHIHRDVKAGNILVDAKSGIKLGDFGVSASLFDSGDRQRMRNTFVGTPCWMAPEVMEQLHGYDFKADIWSFGITALELAHGHAPFSKYPPMKVLLMTLQNAPPCLDDERDRKFSKSFKQMIGSCLVKDPSKRPTAHKLLKQPFFKQARSHDYIVRKILDGLPTLGDRHQALKMKEEELLAQKKMHDGKKEELSQNEYKRGISSWNFDIDDLKTQAALIPDHEDTKDPEKCQMFDIDGLHDRTQESMSVTSFSSSKDYEEDMEDALSQTKSVSSSQDQNERHQRMSLDISDYELKVSERVDQHVLQNGTHFQYKDTENGLHENFDRDVGEKRIVNGVNRHHHERNFSTSSLSSDVLTSTSSKIQSQLQNMANGNGSNHIMTDTNADMITKMSNSTGADDPDDKSKTPLVQQKGRFKVTSENFDLDKTVSPIGLPRSQSVQIISQSPSPTVLSTSDAPSRFGGYALFPMLHSMLQINIIQRDNILSLMRQLSSGDSAPASNISSSRSADGVPLSALNNVTERTLLEIANEREKELMQENIDLQSRLVSLQDELQRVKAKNTQV